MILLSKIMFLTDIPCCCYPHVPPFSGVPAGVDLSPKGKGYTTIVRNNIIVNTQKRTKDPNGTGYAVINYHPETHTFVLENNCLYNNVGGNYKNCKSTTDIYVNPLFADQKNHDYHLQSTCRPLEWKNMG